MIGPLRTVSVRTKIRSVNDPGKLYWSQVSASQAAKRALSRSGMLLLPVVLPILLFIKNWIGAALIFAVLVVKFIAEFDAYYRCWHRHIELQKRFPEVYQAVLAQCLREQELDSLIDSSWIVVRIALQRELGLKKTP